MNSDPTSLEAQLREMRPMPLDASFLLRLEAAAEGTLAQPGPAEVHFERELAEHVPAAIPADLMARLEAATQDAPFGEDGKIVPFPSASTPAARDVGNRPMLAAAAAVALIGAVSALVVPIGTPVKNPSSVAKAPASVTTPAANLLPATFNRGVSGISDEGVIWKSDNKPHSVIRVEYMDIITLKDKNGRTVQVEQPRVEYLMVPAKTD